MDNMKKNAMGNGSTQCILCADEFGLLGASPTYCDDCHKVMQTRVVLAQTNLPLTCVKLTNLFINVMLGLRE